MPNIDKDKRARIQWAKMFEPRLYSRAEMDNATSGKTARYDGEKVTQDKFEGGDEWDEEEDE